MSEQPYFPESENELERLENKTDTQAVIDQAVWAGLKPGMRVLDVGCGPGVTTASLARCVGPGGSVVGVDRSAERIDYARSKYGQDNIDYVQRNFFSDLSDLGSFDFVWIRFVLEYFLKESYQLASHVAESIKPGGIFCIADLDLNCMNHYGASERLDKTFRQMGEAQMKNNNFDPYAGRKLSTHLYDLGFIDIHADVRTHHLVCGDLSEFNRWNWWHKIELAGRRSGWTFEDYEDGFAGFEKEFKEYFSNPRRFVYTPLIIARGIKPTMD
jgi:ubiquinone/menaquinone biosynthesis C-methylase UbiE